MEGLAIVITLISMTFIICLTCIISQMLGQKYDKDLPERLERFKLEQFKDGVNAVKTLRANVSND